MAIDVKLDVFEGPLDLLLHLIDVNKIDIYDIPISLITDQYLAYLEKMQENDMEIMSEFLVMAAMLLRIKSKMLLPPAEDDSDDSEDAGDPRTELVARLLEYKMYKYAAEELKDLKDDAQRTVYKEQTLPSDLVIVPEKPDLHKLVGELDLKKLRVVFDDVIKRQDDRIDPVRSKYGRIEQEEISLADRLTEVEAYAGSHKSFSFRQLLSVYKGRISLIVTFLAILELMRRGTIMISQEHLFDDIMIKSLVYNN